MAMSDISLTIWPECAEDAFAIERLHERTFGPGRYAKTAYRIREGVTHRLDLSFTARVGTLMVGSVRLSPVRIGETKALLLGPLTVEPAFRERGIGQGLIERGRIEVGDAVPQRKIGRRRFLRLQRKNASDGVADIEPRTPQEQLAVEGRPVDLSCGETHSRVPPSTLPPRLDATAPPGRYALVIAPSPGIVFETSHVCGMIVAWHAYA